MKLSRELDYRIRYDVEHDLFHAQNIFNDEYIIKPTFIEYVQRLEKENAGLKCECRRCVYTDSPCVRGDYPMNDGHCSHFKDVFDENAELRKELKQAEKVKVVEHFEAYGQCRDSRRIAELEAKLTKAIKHLKDLVYVVELGKNELATARIVAEAKEFLKETK